MQRRARFPMGLASASRARAFVRSELVGWGLGDLVDDALLVVTELVVNATLHAQSPTEVRLARVDGGVRIEVRDHSPALPSRREFGPDAVTGRGLHILDALAPGWHVVADRDGKVVVAEVARSPRPAGRASGGG